jgi:ribosomal protein L29
MIGYDSGMSSIAKPNLVHPPLPEPIRETLEGLRGLLNRFVFSQAIIQLGIWCLVSFWLFGAIDYLPAMLGAAESPRWVRVGMLAIIAIGILVILYRQIWQRWLVRWSDSALALVIERKYPEFQSALVTTVQASQPSRYSASEFDHPNRPGLLAIARQRAIDLLPTVSLEELVRTKPLFWQLVLLGVCLIASVVLGLLRTEWSYHWAKRLYALSNENWPRSVVLGVDGLELEIPSFTGIGSSRQRYLLEFNGDQISIPRGQSAHLKSYASLEAKRVPDLCTVYYRDDEGNRGRANMRRMPAIDKKQGFLLDGPPLESISQSLWFSIVGGDARLSNLRLNAVDAPMIVDMQLRVQYPGYLQRSTQSRWGEEELSYRTGLRLPQGTSVELVLKANKKVRRCDFVLMGSQDPSEGSPKEQTFQLENVSESFQVPLGVLNSNVLAEFRLWDTDGICSSRVQQFALSAIIDQPPQVDMILDGIGTAITEIALIPIMGKVKDEYDVDQTWVEATLDENSPLKIPTSRTNNSDIDFAIDCKELRDSGRLPTKAGSTLAIHLVASDFYDLKSEGHLGKANTVQLSIVTAEQLLLLLDRREAAMRKRLEQIIGEVGQLKDLLMTMNRRETDPTTSPELSPAVPVGSSAEGVQEDEKQKKSKLQLLRSQQALSQLSKSEGELKGVEKEIAQISRELINNRVDSVDRRTRWQDKIQKPLLQVLEKDWIPFSNDLASLEKLFLKSPESSDDAKRLLGRSIEQNILILAALQTILADMLEIQDQTAIIDMLRDLIDNSSQMIDETKGYKKQQDRKALDLR